MAREVAEHVGEGVPDLGGRAEHVRVVAVGEDGAATSHEPVERASDANLEPLHAARERRVVLRLEDEVEVVALDRHVCHAHEATFARGPERVLDDPEASPAAQVPHVLLDPQRHVHGVAARRPPAAVVRDAGAPALRLPASATPLAAADGEGECELREACSALVHSATIAPRSDNQAAEHANNNSLVDWQTIERERDAGAWGARAAREVGGTS